MPTEIDQQQFAEQLAQQLKGIALPDAVSWWPLAIGWWIVIAFSLLAIAFCSIKLVTKIQQNKYRKTALNELQLAYHSWQGNNGTAAYLQSSNSILKRVIRKIEHNSNAHNSINTTNSSPNKSINKSGNDWSSVLQRYAKRPLSEPTLSALSSSCYQPNPEVDVPHVHEQLTTWLKNHKRLQDA